MRRTRDHRTTDLFDPWAFLGDKRRLLLERSWAGVFRNYLLERLPVGKMADHFSAATGRPTKDLYAALGVLILQQLQDLTDAAAIEAMAFNIAWHYALDVRAESDAYLCEKTLRNYRRLVIEKGLDRLLFEGLTDELIKVFSVDTSRQRLDSTAIRSVMRCLTRLGAVVETISKFVRELAHAHPDLHGRVDRELIRRYVEREGEGCFSDTTPSESKRRLPESAQDLLHLSLAFEATEAAELESFKILQRVLREQFEVLPPTADDAGASGNRIRVKEPAEIPCDNVRNPADPDSSYNAHRGQGYLAQVMETYQEDDDPQQPMEPKPDLITHIAVGKMTGHDGHQLEPALKDVTERMIKPGLVLADTPYGCNENMKSALAQGVELISPSITAKGAKIKQLTLEQFELDDNGLVTRCPAGHAPLSTSASSKKLQVRFDPALCTTCPLCDRCPVKAERRSSRGRRLQYTRARVLQRQRRLCDESDAFRHRYRWRAGMEATMSRLKHQMRLAHLRVRGMKAVSYVVKLSALGLNIRRCSPFMAA